MSTARVYALVLSAVLVLAACGGTGTPGGRDPGGFDPGAEAVDATPPEADLARDSGGDRDPGQSADPAPDPTIDDTASDQTAPPRDPGPGADDASGTDEIPPDEDTADEDTVDKDTAARDVVDEDIPVEDAAAGDAADEGTPDEGTPDEGTAGDLPPDRVDADLPCVPADPPVEACNGLDDDCNGLTDEGTPCDDDDPCTEDRCHQTACSHIERWLESCAFEGCVPVDPGQIGQCGPCMRTACDRDTGFYGCAPAEGCTSPDLCQVPACDVSNDRCVLRPTDCDDGNLCTEDFCDIQSGCWHRIIDCNDDEICTRDSCLPAEGCLHVGIIGCDPCYVFGGDTACDDHNACSVDLCNRKTGACDHTWTSCDDGDPCTFDYCNPSTGQCSNPPRCDDGFACTTDRCDPATLACEFDRVTCPDDGDPCTEEFCSIYTGQCVSAPPSLVWCNCFSTPQCDPADGVWWCYEGGFCNIEYHDPHTGTCGTRPVVCDDGNPCTVDFCNSMTGECRAWAVDCSDGDPCTDDTCDPGLGGCMHQVVTGCEPCDGVPSGCDDGDLCTEDICNHATGRCEHRTYACPDDGDPCMTATCAAATGCTQAPAGGPCDWPGHWRMYDQNPVLVPTATAASQGADNVYAPSVLKVGTEYWMWYGGQGGDGHDRIFHARSLDGLTWSKYRDWDDPQPVIDRGASNHVNDPSVVQVDGTFHLFYTDAATGEDDRIHAATSTDGIHWTLQGRVLDVGPAGSWEAGKVGRPSVVFEGGLYRMWYDGQTASGRHVGYATSLDGVTFTKHAGNPILLNQGAVDVQRVGDLVVLLAEDGEGTRLFVSRDGLAFKDLGGLVQRSGLAFDAFGQVTPHLLVENGVATFLYFGGASDACWCKNRIAVAHPESVSPLGCGACLAGKASCQDACQDGPGPDGVCGAPGSTNPSACCACVDWTDW